MQLLRKGFREAVRQSLEHNDVVVVVVLRIFSDLFVHTVTGGDAETADIVGHARGDRRDEVGQAHIGLAVGLLYLLAQVVQGGQGLGARFVGIHRDIVGANPVGGPEAHRGTRAQQFFVDNAAQHCLGIIEELGGLGADHLVLQDSGVLARQFPGDEEGGPVYGIDEVLQRVIIKYPGAEKRRARRRVRSPIELQAIGHGLGVAELPTARLAIGDALAHFLVLRGAGRHEGGLAVTHQLGSYGHAAGGVRHIHHHVPVIAGVDLHRRVRLGGGGPADHQRNIELQALHLTGDIDHLVQGGRDQATQADDIDLLLPGRAQDVIAGDHDAQVDDLEVIALQHHTHDILADVVHIALHRGHQDLAIGAVALGFLFLDKGLQVGHRLLHDPGTLDHLRQEHLALAKQVSHHVHTVHQRALDHLDGALE